MRARPYTLGICVVIVLLSSTIITLVKKDNDRLQEHLNARQQAIESVPQVDDMKEYICNIQKVINQSRREHARPLIVEDGFYGSKTENALHVYHTDKMHMESVKEYYE